MELQDTKPWYRHFWPWFMLGILGLGICASSIAVTLAVRNPPDIVSGDYRPLGKLLVDSHLRHDRAVALGLSGELMLTPERLGLSVAAADPASLPATLMLQVQHPADSARDQQILMRRHAAGTYRGVPVGALPVRGRIIVSDTARDWWISGRIENAHDRVLRLAPERL